MAPALVWVRGEHDVATCVHLSLAIARAGGGDDDVVVDLSGVTFMDASTIGALIGGRNRLLTRSRSLSVRAPSPRARQLLDLCDLDFLIAAPSVPAPPPAAVALSSWVAVPAGDRSRDPAQPPEAPALVPEEAARATVQSRAEPGPSTQPHRTPT